MNGELSRAGDPGSRPHATNPALASEPATMEWGSSPEFFGPAHLFRVALLARWLRRRLPSGRVLDLGCGRGTLSFSLAAAGYHVVGLDRAGDFVRYAAARAAETPTDAPARFVEGDATALPFREASFDGVISGEVLEHLRDDHAAVAEVVRVLKPGGWLALTVPAGPQRFGWADRWAGHERRYDRSSLRRLLVGAELRVERIAYWGFPLMRLYQATVQRPAIKAKQRSSTVAGAVAMIGRSAPVVALAAALFRLDPIGERLSGGAGLIALARRPGRQPNG